MAAISTIPKPEVYGVTRLVGHRDHDGQTVYQGVLTVGNTPAGKFAEDDWGGPIRLDAQAERTLEAAARIWPPITYSDGVPPMPATPELILAALLDAELNRRRVRRWLKANFAVLSMDKGVRYWSRKKTDPAAIRAHALAKYPGARVLEDMPEAEAIVIVTQYMTEA